MSSMILILACVQNLMSSMILILRFSMIHDLDPGKLDLSFEFNDLDLTSGESRAETPLQTQKIQKKMELSVPMTPLHPKNADFG